MITYLGITIEDLMQAFETTIEINGHSIERSYEAPYSAEGAGHAIVEPLREADDDEGLLADELEVDDDEEEFADVFVDDEGRVRSLGESIAHSAEALVSFLTDYLITDAIDDSWLTLDQARGMLLALRLILPELVDLPEAIHAYSFKVNRDAATGLPNFTEMKTLPGDSARLDSLVRTASGYEGVVSDETALEDLMDGAGVPDEERFALTDAIAEGIFHLADDQSEISLDVRNFRSELLRLKGHVDPRQAPSLSLVKDTDLKH